MRGVSLIGGSGWVCSKSIPGSAGRWPAAAPIAVHAVAGQRPALHGNAERPRFRGAVPPTAADQEPPMSQGGAQRRGGLGAWLAWGPRFAEQPWGVSANALTHHAQRADPGAAPRPKRSGSPGSSARPVRPSIARVKRRLLSSRPIQAATFASALLPLVPAPGRQVAVVGGQLVTQHATCHRVQRH